MTDQLPTIQLLATGGTIANPPTESGYLSGDELVERIDFPEGVASFETTVVSRKPSGALGPPEWYALAERIHAFAAREKPPAGVVITHGSNTVEETAYFLNLVLETDLPVALTAAQRNQGTVGYDGERNLLDAVRVVLEPEARDQGVLVVANDQIHHAREVTKVVSGRPDAWTSGDVGPVGMTDKYGFVQFYRRSLRPHTTDAQFDVRGANPDEFPRVDVVYSTASSRGDIATAAVEAGADGIVVAGLPTGDPAEPEQWQTLEEIATSGTPVVLSTRGTQGWVRRPLLDETPFVWGDNLRPPKARILLGLAILETDHDEAIQEMFARY